MRATICTNNSGITHLTITVDVKVTSIGAIRRILANYPEFSAIFTNLRSFKDFTNVRHGLRKINFVCEISSKMLMAEVTQHIKIMHPKTELYSTCAACKTTSTCNKSLL